MERATTFQYVATILAALAHLAGMIVAAVLLSRRKGTAALLAVIAFALLVLLDAGRILDVAILPRLLFQLPRAARGAPWITGGSTCCCGLLDLLAIGCLIAALWIGLGGPKAGAEQEEKKPSEEAAST